MLLELLELAQEAKNFPQKARDAVAEVAAAVGLDPYPRIFALVRKAEDGGRWELIAVSLELETLPAAEPGQFLLSGQLDTQK